MYGMVNKAIEDMVCMHHGEEAWEAIKARAGVDVDVFMSNQSYPDAMTYDLVAAASAQLGAPADQVLDAFGRHWILHTAQKGYGGLLKAAGSNIEEFLRGLPNFHSRVSMIFPALNPPRFEVSEAVPGALTLHYHSDRPGLTPFMVGLLYGLGELFATPLSVEPLQRREDGASHDTFRVRWQTGAA